MPTNCASGIAFRRPLHKGRRIAMLPRFCSYRPGSQVVRPVMHMVVILYPFEVCQKDRSGGLFRFHPEHACFPEIGVALRKIEEAMDTNS